MGGETTRYVYDLEKVLQEVDGEDGTTEQQFLTTDKQYGELVSAYSGGESQYYQSDALGSTDALLDDSASPLVQYAYQAYGLATQSPPDTNTNPYTWVGKQGYHRDWEVDLYFLGMGSGGREYDPATARFLSPDPREEKGGRCI